MRLQLFLLLFALPGLLVAQQTDSLAIIETDKLIQLSVNLTARQSLDSAMLIIQQAEKMALDKIGNPSHSYGHACLQHGRIAHAQRNLEEAETWYQKAVEVLRVKPGRMSMIYPFCLNSRAILDQEMGKSAEAKAGYLEVIAIYDSLGQEKTGYATSINNLAIVCQDLGDLDEAETYFLEARELLGQSLGREHPYYASCVNNLGGLYYVRGKNELAKPLFVEAIAIRRKSMGNQDPDLAETINNLANLYAREEKIDSARLYFKEASDIREAVFGPHHPVVAGGLIDLAQFYTQTGQFSEAEKHFIQAREILESRQSANNPSMYFNCLTQLAALYSRMGQYDKAEPLFLDNLKMARENLGEDDPYAILSISKLGLFYQSLGDEEKAEDLFKEHLERLEKQLGKEHEEYGKSLNILANLYSQQGRDSRARPLYEQALTILENAIGKNNSNYATVVNSLASLEFNSGNYAVAEPLFEEALASYAVFLGKEHPYYAGCLGNLGNLYVATREFEKAEPLCQQSKAIFEEQYGRQHPEYVFSVKSLANLYERQGRIAEADTLLKEVFVANEARIGLATSFMSEEELAKYIQLFESDGNDLYGYLYARTINKQDVSQLSKLSFDHTLYYKGFLLLAASRLNKLAQSTEASSKVFERLKGFRKQLAFEYAKPIKRRSGVDELEKNANAAEKELAQLVAGYGKAMQQVRWSEVQSSLKEDEVAIEFVHFHEINKEDTDSLLYAALLLRAGSTTPEFLPLCREIDLAQLVRSESVRGADYVNRLYSASHRGFVSPASGPAPPTLYELIWEKIHASGLNDVKTIYFSPTGLLHRINIGAIPIGNDSVLTNRYHMIMVNSARQVPGYRSDTLVKPVREAQLFGAIQFDPHPDAIGASASVQAGETAEDPSTSSSRSAIATWEYLSATEKEVNTIKGFLEESGYSIQSTTTWGATEDYVKEIGRPDHRSPALFHMATHGFFFPEPKDGEDPSTLAQPVFVQSKKPMMRSGLILSGANYAWKNGRPLQEGFEDGILTAYEISQLDLSQTELVVLSACETGLGDIRGNEGVYGLQRAFKIAGVRYLIMTLWKVDDRATAKFMIDFYRHLLIDKMGIPEAFQLTQQEFIENAFSPYLWAGFVLLE